MTSLSLLDNSTLEYRSGKTIRRVFRDLTLEIEEGACTSIIGPNGCGKSSLQKAILGLVDLKSGQVGVQLNDRDYLSAVAQNYRQLLLPHESVKTNICLPCGGDRAGSLMKSHVLDRTQKVLNACNYEIGLNTRVRELSGGQQQALVIARSMAFDARIFLWDEPLAAIDFTKRHFFYREIQTVWGECKATCLLVTHDVEEAILLGKRVIVFDEDMHIIFDDVPPERCRASFTSYLDSPAVTGFKSCIRRAMFGQDQI